jgi:BirA family transcriptional regulator, biotin operon repressor / biotin---[acetyl-CoA-carboxylase] ligase
MSGSGSPLDVETIRSATRDLRLGRPLLYFPTIDSTSSYVMSQAREGVPPGLLVITDEQTAGRGRIGRSWRSLPGMQLEFSLLLKPNFPSHFLVMASAVAVAEASQLVAGIPAGIKWPNDVEVGGKKAGGILIETTSDFGVLGIGLNVNGTLADDPLLGSSATTLADAAGHSLSREMLFVELLQRFDQRYAELSTGGVAAQEALRAAWRERLVTLGRRVTVTQGDSSLTGIAEGVDAGGSLLLRRDDGTRATVRWGDVSS